MERALLFCGLWIFILPKLKWNVFCVEKTIETFIVKYGCYIAGALGIIIALNDMKTFLANTEMLSFSLFYLLLLLSLICFVRKGMIEKSIITRVMMCISLLCILGALYITILDAKEVASSCVILTAVLMILSAPYDVIKKEAFKNKD